MVPWCIGEFIDSAQSVVGRDSIYHICYCCCLCSHLFGLPTGWLWLISRDMLFAFGSPITVSRYNQSASGKPFGDYECLRVSCWHLSVFISGTWTSSDPFYGYSFSFVLAVYRIYTSILFHGSFLHVFFNMLALVPLGSELERIMGSVRLLYTTLLLALSNAVFHLFVALLVAHNPFHPYPYLMNECAIGFSGVLFSMIVIEASLSGVQSRRLVCVSISLGICLLFIFEFFWYSNLFCSVFGLFNVPTKW